MPLIGLPRSKRSAAVGIVAAKPGRLGAIGRRARTAPCAHTRARAVMVGHLGRRWNGYAALPATLCGMHEGFGNLERAKGLEPSTPTLARSCSTTELHPHPKLVGGNDPCRQPQSYAKCALRMQQPDDGARLEKSPEIMARSAGLTRDPPPSAVGPGRAAVAGPRLRAKASAETSRQRSPAPTPADRCEPIEISIPTAT